MSQEILAVAAGHEITTEEYQKFLQRLPQEQQAYMANPQMREQLLTQIMDFHLFAKLGADEKLDETEDFKKLMDDMKTELLSQMAISNLIKDITVSEDEIKEYYDSHSAQFHKGPQANAKHILVDEEEKCQNILAEINAGDKTFEAAAQEYSTCPSKAQGGDLGTFGRGQMVPEFDKAVFEAEELGKVIGPVKTQFGYHLIKVEKLMEESTATLEEVSDQIRNQVLGAKQNQVYTEKVAELAERYGKEVK
jgi:peptidyl-prolyl cis-trans isomerase C